MAGPDDEAVPNTGAKEIGPGAAYAGMLVPVMDDCRERMPADPVPISLARHEAMTTRRHCTVVPGAVRGELLMAWQSAMAWWMRSASSSESISRANAGLSSLSLISRTAA